MKNYFNFRLTGKQLLPVWIVFLVLVIVPYILIMLSISDFQYGATPHLWVFPVFLLVFIAAFAITFYIAKLSIDNIGSREKTLNFNGGFGAYTGKILLGTLLTIITLSVYMAWFIRNVFRFFVDNTSYNAEPFKFKGEGGKLFVILLLTLYLPVILLSVIMGAKAFSTGNPTASNSIVTQIITTIIMIPYMYMIYKWMANIQYKDLHIKWETDFWQSCGKIALEILLSIITLGIYIPLATVKLYKYFSERTVAVGTERKFKFGYDIEPLNDFLFIWGQLLLTLITIGIYYPWAYCKIGSRLLRKTYMESN